MVLNWGQTCSTPLVISWKDNLQFVFHNIEQIDAFNAKAFFLNYTQHILLPKSDNKTLQCPILLNVGPNECSFRLVLLWVVLVGLGYASFSFANIVMDIFYYTLWYCDYWQVTGWILLSFALVLVCACVCMCLLLIRARHDIDYISYALPGQLACKDADPQYCVFLWQR